MHIDHMISISKLPVCHFDFSVSPGNPASQKNGPAKPPFRCKIKIVSINSLVPMKLLAPRYYNLHLDLQSTTNTNH